MMSLLITGASGQLGAYLLRELRQLALPVRAWSGSRSGVLFGWRLQPVDLTDRDAIASAFREARPSFIIHAGAMTSVAECFREPARAEGINRQGTALLAELAAEAGARLLLVSTDLVFDGERGWYCEADTPAPLSTYGRTKVLAEQATLAGPRNLVARVSLLFGPSLIDRPSFFDEQVKALRQRQPCRLFEDEWRTPLSLAAAARGLIALAQSGLTGIIHLGGPERLSRLEMGQRLATWLRADPAVLIPSRRADVTGAEPRPRDVSLDSTRWRQHFAEVKQSGWDEALREMELSQG